MAVTVSNLIDETHDPALTSWVESANKPETEFPIQNLPVGTHTGGIGVAIGDKVLDLNRWLAGNDLRPWFALSATERHDLRCEVSRALRTGSPPLPLLDQAECNMLLPSPIRDYTDFYASIDHATNVGKMFRPDQPLLRNYKHVPIAYHGRASSVIPSGSSVQRPYGQLGEGDWAPTRELDYELELGTFIGPGNALGEPIPINQSWDHLAGLCLLNDWSARDIQRWEYQPLGPFLAKSFATTISPWIVTADALAPFRVPVRPHDVPVLPYLQSPSDDALVITLEVWLRAGNTREPVRVSRSYSAQLYWSVAQMIAHHTSNGCPLRPGDLLGSGTVSGPEEENRGCLLELTEKGAKPLQLSGDEQRTFLADGDEVVLRGYCEREGFRRIGFGICAGIVSPPRYSTNQIPVPPRPSGAKI